MTLSDVDSKELASPEKEYATDVRVATSLDEEQLNAGGAAVEKRSPLGQHFGWFSVICLNLSQMVSKAHVVNSDMIPDSWR